MLKSINRSALSQHLYLYLALYKLADFTLRVDKDRIISGGIVKWQKTIKVLSLNLLQ